jgi:hypothetical protein
VERHDEGHKVVYGLTAAGQGLNPVVEHFRHLGHALDWQVVR